MSQDTPKSAAFGPWVEAPASAQQEAPEDGITLEQAESHAHICSKLAEQHKSDPVLFAALTDAAAIIRDLLRERLRDLLSASAARKRAERMAEALEDVRSRSTINLAMRSDTFELTARLGDIYQIADAALSKENSND